MAFPHEEATREHHALALWGGHGAVRLLAADAGSCALLLERLDACRSLLDVPLDTAVTVWGGVVRQLSVVPDEPAAVAGNRPRGGTGRTVER